MCVTGPGDERCPRSKTVHSSNLGAASDSLWHQLRQHSGGRVVDKVKPESNAALLVPGALKPTIFYILNNSSSVYLF